MKLITKLFLSVIPLLLLYYSFQNIFVSMEPCLNKNQELVEKLYFGSMPDPRFAKDCKGFHISKGFLFQLSTLRETLKEVNDPLLPSDGKLEGAIDRMERVLLAQKIYLGLNIFVALLSISAIVSLFIEAWFGKTLSIASYIIFMLYFFRNIGGAGLVVRFGEKSLGFGLLFLQLFYLVITIGSIIKVIKSYKKLDTSYKKLYNSSFTEEDSSSISRDSTGISGSAIIEWFKIAIHFALIIFFGFFLGNAIYVPLFSLQKHYSIEFGFILFGSLMLLFIFYTINYFRIGKDEAKSFLANLSISFSFLQYRILRNTIMGTISLLGVILFIVFLFAILLFNISFLKSFHLIEESINL